MTSACAQENGLHFLWDDPEDRLSQITDPDLNHLKGTHPI